MNNRTELQNNRIARRQALITELSFSSSANTMLDSDLRAFLAAASALTPSSSLSSYGSCADAALGLLSSTPAASRDAVLAFYAALVDLALDLHLRGGHDRRSADAGQTEKLLERLRAALEEFVGSNPDAWAPIVVKWCLGVLGEMSTKYVGKISKTPHSSALGLHEALPLWLECHPTRTLIDLTALGLTSLTENHEKTEDCISVLLDTSVRHSPHFDWVVAHVGGCFPETVIGRVLTVGLKDFCQSAETQISKDGSFNLSRVPKLNSVVGILEHLASTHSNEIRISLNELVQKSLQAPKKALSEQQIGTIPFLLYLASLSEMLRATLTDDIYSRMMSGNSTEKIASMFETWEKKYFPEGDALVNLVVHLIVSCEQNSKDVVRLLLDLGSDKSSVGRDVRLGVRYVFELVLSDLQTMVHQTAKFNSEEVSLLKSLDADFLLKEYMLTSDLFQRRSMITLMHFLSLNKGRTVAVKTIKYCVNNAKSEEELGVLLEFIKDTELWIPDIVDIAISQCIKSKQNSPMPFIRNLGQILQYQKQSAEEQKLRILSQFSEPVSKCQMELLPHLGRKELIPEVLKVFHFVPLSLEHISVSLLFRTAHHFVHTIFTLLEDRSFSDEDRITYITSCVKTLLDVTKLPPGLPMVLRFLVEGAINSRYAKDLFGAKSTSVRQNEEDGGVKKNESHQKREVKLLEENLKFGSMPTHPLGTSTVFHAGVIGDGKRRPESENTLTRDVIDFNQFTFLSLLFKICQAGGRERAKEASKQLALLLVEMVSPDVMYNGLPWPEEEFTKVTIERDLKISKSFENHPLLWKVMMGLAEARPALCYCSVLLRALMAVQMNFWQASVATKAANEPQLLQVTKKVLELMSVGQFLPHPLNAVSDVLHVMHAFHVNCILVDIWNYMKDNVPSPVAFASNNEGALTREFEPYKNYKNYCERLRLIMIHHIDVLPKEFKRFFVDVAIKHEEALKIAMEY